MTVSSIVPVNTYMGNSTVKKFDFDFLIESENELIVQHISEDNVITTLTLGVDYSINEIGNQNGSYIIFPLENSSFNILKENEKITLMLTLAIKQESEFKNSSYFNLNILEWTFDYIVRILQILSRKIERCVKVGEGLSSSPDELMDELNELKRIAINAAESALESKNIAEENKNECIEYLEEYNQKVLDFNNEYNECLQSIIDKGIDTRCDLDLANLSETGEKHFLNKTQVTNCILEIPQNINLTISNGVLTLNQGCIVYIPDGFESDGRTPKFLEKVVSSDATSVQNRTGQNFAFATFSASGAGALFTYSINKVKSGTDYSGFTGMFYDTSTNKISLVTNGTIQSSGYSLPVGIATATSTSDSKFESIDQVFNGIGYIGKTLFALPNVKGLIPNGRNTDGTLKNTELNLSNPITFTRTDEITGSYGLSISPSSINASSAEYNYTKNLNILPSSGAINNGILIGSVTHTNGNVTSISTDYTFRALNYNDTDFISSQAFPSNKYIDLTIGTNGSSYKASSNGWYLIWLTDGVTAYSGKFITMRNETTKMGSYSLMDKVGYNNIFLPVSKGQTITIWYDLPDVSKLTFRFIYAQGEQ